MVNISNWKKTYTQAFFPFANTLVKAISIPKKIPPMEDKISPTVGLVNMEEKSHPFPHKIKEPAMQNVAAKIEAIVGFSLTNKNMHNGTATQDNDSKKVFFAGVVVSNPMNWSR